MTVRASLPGRQLCVFEGDTEVIEGLKIRHTHQKKKRKRKSLLGCWTVQNNPVQTGFWHIQPDTIANGFNFA